MAKINEQDIDNLRERVDIVELVSGYTTLKKAGSNRFKGLCPFHSEKTPSFTVDAAKSLWFCFGCSEGGNVYQFVQKVENLPFPEAVDWLARKTGFELRYEEMRSGEQSRQGVKARLLEANAAAADYWHKVLLDSPDGIDARRYLSGRGFGKEVAQRWRLGFAPGRNSLVRHLLSKGFTEKELLQADLGRKSERDGSLYDTFRQRITFPTWDLQGGIVGFGARALGDQQPKYLNSAETMAFQKSRVMYGLNRAKSSIARGAPALVVEGYTDVIALHEAGIEQTVATNGVALGASHFEQLKKFTERAILMLDSDAAGQAATERSFDVHYRLGVEVLVATLPAGRDPADVVKEDGPEAIKKVVESAQPMLGFKLEQLLSKLPLDTPEARAQAVRRVAQVLGWHPDPIARHEYTFLAAERIGVESETVQRALSEELSASELAGGQWEREQDRRLPGHVKVERQALQLLLTKTSQVAGWVETVRESDFTSPPRRELFKHALELIDSGRTSAGPELAEKLSPDGVSLYAELTVGEEAPDAEVEPQRINQLLVRIKVFSLERDIKKRRQTLQEINPVADPQRHDDLFTQLVALEAERRDLLRRLQGAG